MIRFITALLFALFALAAQAGVDVNKASQAELETIKGIGPGLSAKILDARKAGVFKDWADMVDRVGGVGPGNARKFSQAGLTVAGSGYTPAAGGDSAAKTTKAKTGDAADKAARKSPKPDAVKPAPARAPA